MTDPAALLALYGDVPPLAAGKVHARLDGHDRAFVAASPFVVLTTVGERGLLDVSPRGDAPGFLHVLDDETLVLPDRPGNNRVDSLLNVLHDPRASLLVLVPGVTHALRVNGTAAVTTDPAVLELGAERGRLPTTALVLQVSELLFQCSRALLRSHLWDPAHHVAPGVLASLADVLHDQVPGLPD